MVFHHRRTSKASLKSPFVRAKRGCVCLYVRVLSVCIYLCTKLCVFFCSLLPLFFVCPQASSPQPQVYMCCHSQAAEWERKTTGEKEQTENAQKVITNDQQRLNECESKVRMRVHVSVRFCVCVCTSVLLCVRLCCCVGVC